MNPIARSRRRWSALLAALIWAAPLLSLAQPAASEAPHQPRKAKQAVDDRADTRMRTDDVGKGTHFARKPLGQGAYFDDKDRAAVRKFYAVRAGTGCPPGQVPNLAGCVPAANATAPWQIGQALPAGVAVQAVPKELAPRLPKLPPGHRYVQVNGDILLIASGSKMVVDGINGMPR